MTVERHPARDIAHALEHAVEHPIDTARSLEHEAEDGWSARTPAILLGGITIFVGIALVLVLAVTLALYYIYGGP
jgi:hypothetical protein